MDIIMIRHGETEDNMNKVFSTYETVLSEKGIEEIKSAKENLVNYNFDKVYYSPLIRTVESLNHLELEGIPDDRIREYNFGVFSGLTFKEIQDKYPKEHKKWIGNPRDYIIEEGESLGIVYKRVVEFLEERLKEDKDILLVTHGGVIRLVFCWVFDNIDYFQKFQIDNGSINIVSVDNGFKFIKKSNFRPKLNSCRKTASK